MMNTRMNVKVRILTTKSKSLRFLNSSPDMVVVDTEIIAHAPVFVNETPD